MSDNLQIAALAARVAALADAVDELRELATGEGPRIPAWGPAAEPLDTGSWVDWLRDTYELHEDIPECWEEHNSIRLELSALRLAHAAAYDDPAAPATEPLAWHERLQQSLERIKHWDRERCRSRGHAARV